MPRRFDETTATRTWSASDNCGDHQTCSQTVTVQDTTPPDITCPAPKTVECGTPWDFDAPSASDQAIFDNLSLQVFNDTSNDLYFRFNPGTDEVGDEINYE
jgi:hypothetical protein